MDKRRYALRPCDRLSFGYYDENAECFSAQVDILGRGSEACLLIADAAGLKLLVTNPDLVSDLPFMCWCLDDLLPLLEEHGFRPLEGEAS